MPKWEIVVFLIAALIGNGMASTKQTLLDSIIYDHISSRDEDMTFCFRQLNQTHQVGCQTDMDPGNAGTLIYVEDRQQLFDLLVPDNVDFAPFAILMEVGLLTDENTEYLLDASIRLNMVSTVITFRNESLPLEYFSPDYKCPRAGFTNQECNHNWNPKGTGLMWKDFPFGIVFYKNQTIIENIKQHYEKYNKKPLNELTYPIAQYQGAVRMFAAQDSPTCMRRSMKTYLMAEATTILCDSYGGWNKVLTVPPLPISQSKEDKITDNSMTLLLTKNDHLSFFTNTGRGSLTQIILLAVSKALSTTAIQNKLKEADKSIGIMYLASEDFGNIGVDSVLYDMSEKNYPVMQKLENGSTVESKDGILKESESEIKYPKQIDMSSIAAFIELGELGDIVNNPELYFHAKENNVDKDIFETFRNVSNGYDGIGISKATGNFGLPPSSVSRFIDEGHGDASKLGVFISDFNEEYKNEFTSSMYNDNNNYGFPSDYCTDASKADLGSNVATITTIIARSVLKYALGDTEIGDLEVKVDDKTIQELVCCVLISPRDCSAVSNLFEITYADSYGNQIPAEGYQKQFTFNPLIVETSRGTVRQDMESHVIENVMVYYTGEEVNCTLDLENRDILYNGTSIANDKMYKYALFNNATLCMRTPLFKQMAQSTAFRIPDYNLVQNPKNYSLWTESEWAYLTQSRIYLVESPVKQNVSLSLGIISLFFAFLIAWTIKWKASSIFVSSDGITNPVSAIGSS